MGMRLLAGLLVWMLGACAPQGARLGWMLEHEGAAAPPAAEPPRAEPAELPQPEGLPSTALRYEMLGGRQFPYPLVRANVSGHDTWLIVDTGASHIVLARWLVEAAGLSIEASGQRGEGHTGAEVVTYQVRHPDLRLEGWGEVPLDELLVVDLPDVFAKLHLGGVLSPQALAPPGHSVVVDMPGKELRLVPDEWQLDGDRGGDLAPGAARVCPIDGYTRGAVYVVDATIEGRPARLVVDTGASRSDVLLESDAARALLHRSVRGDASYTASGRVDSRKVPQIELIVGHVAGKVDLSIMPGEQTPSCARDGHLGLDVLSRCVMILSPDRFQARCR